MINLYTLPNCGMCRLLKQELQEKNIPYNEINDTATMAEKNIIHVPMLEKDGEFMNFKQGLTWIREGKPND